ncbi:MAG: hypothetical protein L3J74_04820 [Bacteroidales bacterium]|nr:hypothetical protein [Bacteroidales bacterium]
MMRRVSTIFSILLFAYFQIDTIAQTGPAGIGNATGNNNQPTNILWLRADDLGLADGATVSAWPDISGNNNDLSSSVNDPNDPTYALNQINGLPVVRFSSATGTGTKLIRNPFDGFASSEITTIVVYKTSDSGDGLVSYATSGDNNNYLLYDNNNLRIYTGGNYKISSQSYNTNAFTILVEKWRNSDNAVNLFKDGTNNYSNTLGNGNIINDGGSLSIGGEQDAVDGSYSASQAFDGDIAEIIMFSSYLNDAQRIIIENYLQIKYGITIANDYFLSGDSSYINDFTGVGQEADGNHLESSSAGFYVKADIGTLNNGEYIMFAHDTTTNIVSTSDLPAGVQARWARDWYIEKTGAQNATLIFDLPEGIGGQYPQNISNYVLLYRNATTGTYSQVTATVNYGDADQVAFSVIDANLTNGYYTLGTTDQTNSPVEGAPGVTWYTLASGNWNDYQIWTLDPSGALPNNPTNSYPQNPSDKVVIKSGKNVNMNINNIHCNELKVDGRLDLNTSTGHTFDIIKGNGRILMAADNFPAFSDMSDFNTAGQGEGTVVFYGSADYSLSTPYTFYNMEVDMTAGNTVTLMVDYNINGYLRVLQGNFQINDNTSTTGINFTVQGNVSVEAGASILTGTGSARHQFNFYGDFTNNGTVKFTNRTVADYANEATDGIVDANFLNASKDQSILCAGTTNFYRIEIDKGTDATYILDIEATNTANFNLFGYAAENHPDVVQLTANNNALGLLKGTVKLGSNVNISSLTINGNYNISEAAKLWVAGGSVAVATSGNAIVPYGELYVSAGLFESLVTHGIALRKNGVLRVSGGTVNTNIIRTASSSAATNRGSYVQTGGTVNVVNASNSTGDYYHFCLTYPEVTFYMSGGTLHVYDANGTVASEGGIFIASSADNINVTGGTVIAEISSLANPFKVTSTAPFYNFILRNTLDNTTDHIWDAGTGVGPLNVDLTAQPLVVLNDLTIEDNCFLDHNGQDITIGGGFSIAENSQQQGTNNYGLLFDTAKPNTLTFNGYGSDTLYIGHNVDDSYELRVWNLTVNKSTGSEIVLKGDPNKDPTLTTLTREWYNRLLRIDGTTDVKNGTLNQGQQSIRLDGPVFVRSSALLGVYEPGITPLTAYIMLKDDGTASTDINSEVGAVLGNFKLNPGAGNNVGILSDVYAKRVAFYSGSMNLRTYNLKVDYLHRNATLNNYRKTDGSTTEMIYSDANA